MVLDTAFSKLLDVAGAFVLVDSRLLLQLGDVSTISNSWLPEFSAVSVMDEFSISSNRISTFSLKII